MHKRQNPQPSLGFSVEAPGIETRDLTIQHDLSRRYKQAAPTRPFGLSITGPHQGLNFRLQDPTPPHSVPAHGVWDIVLWEGVRARHRLGKWRAKHNEESSASRRVRRGHYRAGSVRLRRRR